MRIQQRSGVSNVAVAIIVLAVVAMTGMFGYYLFFYTPTHQLSVQTTNTNTAGNGSTTGVAIPTLGLTIAPTNTLAGGSVSPTNAVYTFFHYQGARLSALNTLYGASGITLSTSQTTIPLNTQDWASGYVLVSIYAGDTSYTDLNKFVSSTINPYIVQTKWLPVSSTGRLDLVAEISLAAIGLPNYQVAPNLAATITDPTFVETTLGSVTVTAASSTYVNIGVVANTVTTIKWTVAGISSNKGAAIAKVLVQDNDSSTAPVVQLGNLIFGDTGPFGISSTCSGTVCSVAYPGVPYSPPNPSNYAVGGSLTLPFANAASLGLGTAGTSNYQYLYWPGTGEGQFTQLSNAIILANPSNSFGDTTISLQVTTSYASGGHTGIILSITPIAGTGTLSSAITSTITLAAGATT